MKTTNAIDDIIAILLEEIEDIRAEAERRMGALTEAIVVLRRAHRGDAGNGGVGALTGHGGMTDPPARSCTSESQAPPVPVVQRILEGFESLARDAVYNPDQRAVRDRAVRDHPEEGERIKRGVYPAITQLLKGGKIQRCVGGFCIPSSAGHVQFAGPKM